MKIGKPLTLTYGAFSLGAFSLGVVSLGVASLALAGCSGQATAAKPVAAAPTIRALNAEDQASCRKVLAGKPVGAESLVLVVDRTASTPDLPLPATVAADIAATSRRGEALTVIAVNGLGVKPTVLLNRAGTSSDGPRDAPSVERIAQHLPSCVNWVLSSQVPTGRGTDFYPAAALSAEVAGPKSTIWWLTDGEFNAGLINLSAKGWLKKKPDEAARAMAQRGPLDLDGATVKVAGLANTTAPISPQARTWLTTFTKALCLQWNGSGCLKIARSPQTSLTERPSSLPDDPALTFPGPVGTSPEETIRSCYYTAYGDELFDGDSTTLKANPRPIKDLITAMNARPKSSVVVVGHLKAGTAGASELQATSLRRAQAVVDALVDGGIDRSRLKASGVGGTDPATDEPAKYRETAERRVVFRTTGISCSDFPPP